jgi:restriction system protein
MTKVDMPTFDTLMNPLIQVLKALGGSGTVEELNSKVAEAIGLSDEQLEVLHDPDRGGQTEFEYRLAWTRTYLKKYGVLENSSRGV